MLSRALALAMMGLVGCFAAGSAQAQENLEAGQNAAQIYAEACSTCHKSTHGLLKTVRRGSLKGFLKEHYTTSPAMAALLADYLLSHGADDARFVVGPRSGQTKQATRSESRPANPIERLFDSFGHRRNPASQEATAPASEPDQGAKADAKSGERDAAAHHKRQARRAEARDTAKSGAKEHPTSVEPVNARGREGRQVDAKQEVDKHPKPDLGATSKSEAAKVDEGKTPDAKPVSEPPSQSANAEPPKQDETRSKSKPVHAAAAAAPADSGEPAAAPPPPATSSASPAGQPAPPASH